MTDRPCTCHPDDNPPQPCPKKYALSECRAAASLQGCNPKLQSNPPEVAIAAAPCIGNDPSCPCQDGDLCHYKDSPDGKTKAWAAPAEPTAAWMICEPSCEYGPTFGTENAAWSALTKAPPGSELVELVRRKK